MSIKSEKSKILVSSSFLFAVLSVILLIFPSQIALNSSWQHAINLGAFSFIIACFGISLINRNTFPKNSGIIFFIIGCLFISAIISSVMNGWIRPILAYSAFILVIIFHFLLVGKNVNPVKYVKFLILGTVVTALIILVASLASQTFTFNRYQGVFNNPNNMGWMAGSICSLLIGAIYENRLKWAKNQRLFLYGVLFIYGIVLLASNSRAALVAVLATMLLFISIRFFDAFTISSIRTKKFRRILIYFISIILIALIAFIGGLLDPVIEKFLVTHERGDITQNRLIAWYASIINWTWFGLGANYKVLIGMEGQETGHSIYISQLTRYGLIPMLLFTISVLYMWYKGFKRTKNNTSLIAPSLVAVVTGFLINAIFETGASTPGVWLTIILFSAMLIEVNSKKIHTYK